MKSFALITIFITTMILSGCINPDSNNKISQTSLEYPININLTDFIETENTLTNISSIAEEISYVKLETSEEILLGNIGRVRIMDKGYLVQTRKILCMFNKEGKYIWKIDNKGKGPGEYFFLNPYFDINKNTKEIIIPDVKNSLLIYNFDGQFLRNIDIKRKTFHVNVLESGNYLSYLSIPDPYSAITITPEGKILKEFEYHYPSKNYNDFGDRILIWTVFLQDSNERKLITDADTVWLIKNDTLKQAQYIVNTQVKSNNKQVRLYSLYYLRQDYLGISFSKGNYIFDLQTNKKYKINGFQERYFIDDIDGGPHIYLSFPEAGNLIQYLNPVDLINNDSLNFRKDSEIISIIKNLKEDDNIVLRIIRLREQLKIEN